jgi:hypothetical protein
MRIHATAALAAGALLTLAGCANQTAHRPAPHAASSHTATPRGTGSKDLVIPGATAAQARTAIRDYARTIHGAELYYIKVQHSSHATRYVCRARWYVDADSYRTHSGMNEPWPDSWPHLAINCP